MIKYLLSLFLFYFLVLFQTSFLFSSFNLIFYLIIIWNFLEQKDSNLGIFVAFSAGFFLDIFSENFIGFNILILVFSAFIIKQFIRPYVRIPFTEKI